MKVANTTEIAVLRHSVIIEGSTTMTLRPSYGRSQASPYET